MKYSIIPIIFIVFAILLLFALRKLLFSGRRKRRGSNKKNATAHRHKKNIASAARTIDTLAGLTGEAREARVIGYLKKINPYVFEELLLTALSARGYVAARNPSYSGDGGFDGKCRDKAGQTFLIQAKRYNAAVKTAHIEDFAALCRSNSAAGFFIHTGRTPKGKIAEYRAQNIHIISGDALVKLVVPVLEMN